MTDAGAALVTGAGSGIGRATALRLAQAGLAVAATDMDEAGCKETAALIEKAGGKGVAITMDVADADSVAAGFEHAIEHLGPLSHVVNNAGWEGATAPLVDSQEADWQRLQDINLKGTWLCLREALRHMKSGAIVNVASVAGMIGFQGLAPYVASKHGVVGLTRSAALEAAPQGIRVNCVCPGAIQTPMLDRALEANPALKEGMVSLHPIGRIGDADEVAAAIAWLLSDEASFVTGAILPVDGGWTIS